MPADPSPPSRFSLLYALLRGCLAGFVVAWALELVYMFIGPNVHVVAPGAVYRSAQLGPKDLERVVAQHHIRTIVNLCGCCDPLPWYLQESRDSCRLGICQEDVSFSACRLPPVDSMRHLVEVLDRCDYPILLHCHRGIDRTGMASTVALLLHTDATLAEAREQMGLRFGHMSLGRYGNLDRFFDLYQEWLTATNQTHSPAVFRRWIAQDYCPGECRSDIEALDPQPLQSTADEPYGFRVRCTNTSIKPWVLQPGTNAGIHLGWLVFGGQAEVPLEGRSGLFDAVVPAGRSIDLTVALPPLPRGHYEVQLDMVDEQHAWFYQTGGTQPVTLELEAR
jgi:hypothetical protein